MELPTLPFGTPIFSHKSLFVRVYNLVKSLKSSYPLRRNQSGLKDRPPSPETNSLCVFGPAGTDFPSTVTKLPPEIKLSSSFVGTCFALYMSELISPAFLHNSDGNIPETP